MPPKVRITKESIIEAATDIVRESGADCVNARAVAQRLGISTQPIFSNYESMDGLRADVIRYAHKLYLEYIDKEVKMQKYPPYKASGMAYVRFAREERELFKLLFMRDRKNELDPGGFGDDPGMNMSMQTTGLDRDRSELFHFEMWLCIHGIASMIATSFFDMDEETISSAVTDVYQGLRARFLPDKQ